MDPMSLLGLVVPLDENKKKRNIFNFISYRVDHLRWV